MNDQSNLNKQTLDNPIAGLMRHALVEMPFSDFDDRMMVRIRLEAATITQSKRDKNRSSLFFMLGCFFSMCISTFISLGHQITGLPALNGGILWQVITIVLFYQLINSIYVKFVKVARR